MGFDPNSNKENVGNKDIEKTNSVTKHTKIPRGWC
jgi:hypothetical protein